MIQKIKNKLIPIVAFATLIYLLSLIYFDSSSLYQSITELQFEFIFLIFSLMILTFAVKYLRWQYYLTISKIKIPLKDSLLVFASGLLMSISPGKIGEFLKSYLVKSKFNIPMSKTNSVVLAERIIEFMALVLIVSVYIIISNIDLGNIFYILIFIMVFTIYLFTPYSSSHMRNMIKIVPSFNKYATKLQEFRNQLKELFKLKHILNMLILSCLAWLIECYAIFVIIEFLIPDFTFTLASGYYLISIVFGAISMLPAGLGITEGSLAYFLSMHGVSEGIIVTLVFLIRIFTLWFSVFVGFVSIMIYQRRISLNS